MPRRRCWSCSSRLLDRRAIEPARLFEAPVLLNRAVDVLDDSGALQHPERTDAVRELVLLVAAAGRRSVIEGVPSEHRSRQLQRVEPLILDLADREAVARVEVQPNRDLVRFNSQRLAQELRKELDHAHIRIREAQRVPALASLSPVEKATRHVQRIRLAGSQSPFALICDPLLSPPSPPSGASTRDQLRILWSPRPPQVQSALFGGELDVARPTRDARWRHAETPGNPFD
jgi:hypothetical protein